MRLVSFQGGFGRVEDDVVVPMGASIIEFLHTGEASDGDPVDLSDVTIGAPIPQPQKILLVGPNYREHLDEAVEVGEMPEDLDELVLFGKFANSVIGPGEPIIVPPECQEIDPEVELAVVIGKRATRVDPAEAADCIFGYTCANDVGDRRIQFNGRHGLFRGKAIDTFLPVGPCIVTRDEIGDVDNLSIKLMVNGEVRQDANTSDMLFDVSETVSWISQTITLSPGDIVCTGSPPGVGFARTPPVYLNDGDEVEISIENIGTLRNPVRIPR